MDAATREQTSAVIHRLVDNAKDYSFVQAIRLLTLCHAKEYGSGSAFLHEGLKITPELSLGHPSTDLVSVSEKILPLADSTASDNTSQLPQYTAIATFLSLYGASSPLPTFYTEELIDEARKDENACRDFLDIFNQKLYILYYQAYNTAKIGLRTVEQHDARMIDLQYCLLGMGDSELRRDTKTGIEDLGFTSLFTRYTRSAHNLECYLALRLGLVQSGAIRIEQCVSRRMTIPLGQRFRLGQTTATLGEGVIGSVIHDWEGKFCIHINHLDTEGLARFQPGAEGRDIIEDAIHRFLNVPLLFDLVLHTQPKALTMTCLGDTLKGRLGVNAFLAAPQAEASSINYYCS